MENSQPIINIRATEPGDLEGLRELFSCPDVIANTLQLPFPSTGLWEKRLASFDSGSYSLVAVVDQKIVGNTGIHTFPARPRRAHVGTFGMAVHDDWKGKGIGNALMKAIIEMADNWLNLKRLELEVYTDNTPAIKLYEKFGFQVEGTLRKHAFRAGAFVDSYAMARIRD